MRNKIRTSCRARASKPLGASASNSRDSHPTPRTGAFASLLLGKKTPPCSALAAFADRPELFLKELKAHSNGRGKVRSFLTKAFSARLPLKNKAGCTELFRANFTAGPGDQTVGFVLFQQVGDPGSI